jgi:hypothetical protein
MDTRSRLYAILLAPIPALIPFIGGAVCGLIWALHRHFMVEAGQYCDPTHSGLRSCRVLAQNRLPDHPWSNWIRRRIAQAIPLEGCSAARLILAIGPWRDTQTSFSLALFTLQAPRRIIKSGGFFCAIGDCVTWCHRAQPDVYRHSGGRSGPCWAIKRTAAEAR